MKESLVTRPAAATNWAVFYDFLRKGDFGKAEEFYMASPLAPSVLTQILFKCIDGFGDDEKLAEIARFLIAKGAKANARRGGDFKSPLHLALLRNKIKTAEFLISQVAEESKQKTLSLLLLKLMEEIKDDAKLAIVVEFLINNGANINVARPTDLSTPMHLAMVRNQRKTLEVLFKHNPNLNAENCEGRIPQDAALAASLNSVVGESGGLAQVHWGSGHGKPQKSPLQRMMDALPDASVDIPFLVELDDCEVAEIVKQLKYSDYKAYKLFAQGRIDCSKFAPVKAAVKLIEEELKQEWQSVLRSANTQNLYDLTQLETLLQKGANVDWQEPETQKTLLHYAIEQDDEAVIVLLMASGASKEIPDRWGVTARKLESDKREAGANPLFDNAGPVQYGAASSKK